MGPALRGRAVAGICLVLVAAARWAVRGCAGLPVCWHHRGRCPHGHCKAEAKERQGVPGSLQLWCCTRCLGELLPRRAGCESGEHEGQSSVRWRSTGSTQHRAAARRQRGAGQGLALLWRWCSVSRACQGPGAVCLGELGRQGPHACCCLRALWFCCLQAPLWPSSCCLRGLGSWAALLGALIQSLLQARARGSLSSSLPGRS